VLRQLPRATTAALPEPPTRAAPGAGPPQIENEEWRMKKGDRSTRLSQLFIHYSLFGCPTDAARPRRRARRKVVASGTLLQRLPPVRARRARGRSSALARPSHATTGGARRRQRPGKPRSPAPPQRPARRARPACRMCQRLADWLGTLEVRHSGRSNRGAASPASGIARLSGGREGGTGRVARASSCSPLPLVIRHRAGERSGRSGRRGAHARRR